MFFHTFFHSQAFPKNTNNVTRIALPNIGNVILVMLFVLNSWWKWGEPMKQNLSKKNSSWWFYKLAKAIALEFFTPDLSGYFLAD